MFWDERTRKAPSKTMKQLLYDSQNGRCMYCGIKLDIRYMHVDHKTPFSNGGRDSETNFQILCGPCNTLKSNRTDGEFRRLYKLGPTRGAQPPTRAIPRSYFDEISKQLKVKARTAAKKKQADPFGSLFRW